MGYDELKIAGACTLVGSFTSSIPQFRKKESRYEIHPLGSISFRRHAPGYRS